MSDDYFHIPDEWFSDERRAASEKFFAEALALVEKVSGGQMSEPEARKLIADMLGGDDREAGNFLLHTLHQKELNKLRDEQGIIID